MSDAPFIIYTDDSGRLDEYESLDKAKIRVDLYHRFCPKDRYMVIHGDNVVYRSVAV